MFLQLLEYSFAALIIIVVVFQIYVPLFRGRPLFPSFRKQQRLANQLSALDEEIDEAKLERVIDRATTRLQKMREQRATQSTIPTKP